MTRLSPVSASRANGVARLTGYAAWVRSWFAILVTLAACHDPELERLAAIKASVCGCKTASCGSQALAQVPQAVRTSNHRTQALARAMLDCQAKLLAAERPTTDPDAEGSDTEPGSPADGAAAATDSASER
jgi:hypothetical protein